jgi:flagellar biosynthesis protein FlhB
VLSKGEDEDALAIRYEAIRLHIPIVENPPLARILYDTCEMNAEITVELYQRVAKLFAFVYSLSPTAKQLIEVHKMAYSQ